MSAYLTAVLADSPVHYWRLADPGGGLAHDIGSAPFHLGAAGPLQLGYSGPNSDGGSYQVTGSQFLQSLGVIQSITSPFSVEFWFWPIGQNTVNAFLMQWDGVGLPESQAVYLANETCQFSVNNAVTNPAFTAADQNWHHFVGTYSGATGTLYVDGSSRGTFALAGPVTIHKSIAFGGTPNSTANSYQGWLSEIAIYGAALSSTRVAAHFAAADNSSQSPIYQAAGGLGGSGVSVSNPNYLGILQQILQAVRKTFPTT